MDEHKPHYNQKNKNRKARYTFPNELDRIYDKPSRQKHRRRTYTYSVTNYNCDDVVHITEYNTEYGDGVHRKVVVKKYTKTYPEEEDENEGAVSAADKEPTPKVNINTKNILGCLSAIAIKILCFLGLISLAI